MIILIFNSPKKGRVVSAPDRGRTDNQKDRILSPTRLPISPQAHFKNIDYPATFKLQRHTIRTYENFIVGLKDLYTLVFQLLS